MIDMDSYEQILHYYRVDELSLRAIARKLNVDRKTVSKAGPSYRVKETKMMLEKLL